jgi:site-specific recombinase XerD
MSMTNAIVNYRRFLKRRNYSPCTVKNYLNSLKHFVIWVNVPIERVCQHKVTGYIDYLLKKRLKAKTINLHLARIRGFYDYLYHEEEIKMANPVKKGTNLRLSKPLPKHLQDEEVKALFKVIEKPRDRAMFKVMLRCGLRVEEVSDLALADIDLKRKRIHVRNGKGNKDRIVYISQDTHIALMEYLRIRPPSRAKKIFLVEKGTCSGKSISVRGIQKRIEYYARKTRLKVSCHHLRHTMATQLLNADAEIETIQDLLGHNRITTTERYLTVSNLKVERDYYRAMAKVLKKLQESSQ